MQPPGQEDSVYVHPTSELPNDQQTHPGQPVAPKWKRKAYFDGTECGYSGCSKASDGYVAGTKPTKGGHQGALWYGPACRACIRKWHDSLEPISLANLASQRNGASDLALVLDVEVGDVLKRLALAGIDDRGRPFQSNAQAYAAGMEATGQQMNHPNTYGQLMVVSQNPDYIATAPILIPKELLAEKLAYANGVLQQLSQFFIRDQVAMDYTSSFLAEVKGLWKGLEDHRKDLGRPLRDALQAIQDQFNPPLKLLSNVETVLKQKIAEGHAYAQAAQEEAFRLAQQALQQGNTQQAALATQQAVAADVTLAPGVRMTTTIKWDWDPTQPLPQDFWSWVPDPAKVQAAVDAGWRQIPGVRIYEVPVVASVSR